MEEILKALEKNTEVCKKIEETEKKIEMLDTLLKSEVNNLKNLVENGKL